MTAKDLGNQSAYPGADYSPGQPMAGLTKREVFAMAAMQGFIGSEDTLTIDGVQVLKTYSNLAKFAVTCADALLAELAKGKL